jgi:hypothetical protein
VGTNAPSPIRSVLERQSPSFLEYVEYPHVSADEIKKELALKASVSGVLDLIR